MTEQSIPTGEVSSEERFWALASHSIPLAALWFSAGFLGFVASIITYVLAKDRGPFAHRAAAQALNVQLTGLIGILISLPLMLVLIGFVTFGLVILWMTVLHVVALVKAADGKAWDPPLTFKFVGSR